MTDWKFKTYRVEWLTEVYDVDQYEQRCHDGRVYYEQPWPTREEAQADLERVAHPHKYVQGRWTSPLVNHEYHACGVRYRETEQK